MKDFTIARIYEPLARRISVSCETLNILKELDRWIEDGAQSINFNALVTDDDQTTFGDLVMAAIKKYRES